MEKIKKVFSPGKDQDDAVMYGSPSKEGASTGSTTQAPQSSTLETRSDAAQKDKGVLRQVFNPGGDKHSEQSYGTTATAKPAMSDQLQKEPASNEPLKGAETAQHNNDKVQQEPIDSTLTSGGSAAGTTTTGPSTMAREDKKDDVSNATYTARSYALGSGSSAEPQQTSSNVEQATRATTDLRSTGDELPREDAGRRLDNSLTGAATGGAGAGYVGKKELDEFMRHGRDPEADQATYLAREHYLGSSSDADPFQQPGHELYSADKGPGGVQSAGQMAPGHIPGEFPSEDGGDPHSNSSRVGTGAATAAGLGAGGGAGAGAGAAGMAASKAYNDSGSATGTSGHPGGSGYPLEQSSSPIQSTTNTMRSGSFSKPSQEPPTATKSEEKESSGGFKGALAAATAAMGFGGAGAYVASKSDDENNAPTKPIDAKSRSQPAATETTSRSLPPQSSVPTSETKTRKPEDEGHTARNAALGVGGLGAVGAGAYALSQNDRDSPSTATAGTGPKTTDEGFSSSSATTGTNTGNAQSVVSEKTQSYAGHRPSDRDSSLQSSGTSAPSQQIPTSMSSQPPKAEEDHTARNTALGAGLVGAAGAGAGAYAMSNRDDSGADAGNAKSVVSSETQNYSGTHPSDTDASYKGTVASTQPRQPEEDHTARNTALGAGAVGAAGAGAYAANNRDNSDVGTGNASSVVSRETQKYHHSHPSDSDPSYRGSGASAPVSRTEPTDTPQQSEDHTARNAALGAGAVGATGAGAYALSNRDDNNTTNAQSVVSPETQKYTRSHPSDADPSYSSSGAAAPTSTSHPTTSSQQPREEEDHTARNTALGAGGFAAVGAGAYAMSRDDDKPEQSTVSPVTQKYSGGQPEPTRSQPEHVAASKAREPAPASKAAEPAAAEKVKEIAPTSKPAETTDYRRAPAQPEEEDHTARNAALGAGGVGAAGAGAYALSRDNDEKRNLASTQSPTLTQTRSSTRSYGYPSDRLDDSTTEGTILGARSSSDYGDKSGSPSQQEDHTARNAAMGVGGVGAAGAGAYALRRDNDTGPASKTIGPHESNAANVMDPRVKPEPTQQFERNTAGPYQSNIANRADPRVTSAPSNAYPLEQEPRHEYGRDAAIAGGAGATGAAGYGVYEYSNRDQPPQQQPGQQYTQPGQQHQYFAPPQTAAPQQQQYTTPPRQEDYSQPPQVESTHDPRVAAGSDGHNKLHKKAEPQEEDHTGRNAALGAGAAGTAGAAGYGGKQYYDSRQETSSATDSQESGEKKHGLLHKIMHPREHKREKEEEERRSSDRTRGSYEQSRTAAGPTVAAGPAGAGEAREHSVTEPHTGLPMNVERYGSGQGGTDGSQNIMGYHETGQSGRPY